MRRHCLVTLGNRCAATEAPVPLHKARIFGMSNEQVVCIIHLCSIFHVEEQESGFWSLLGALSGKRAASLLAQCGAPLQELSQWDPVFGNVCVSVYDPCEYMQWPKLYYIYSFYLHSDPINKPESAHKTKTHSSINQRSNVFFIPSQRKDKRQKKRWTWNRLTD